MSGKKQPRRLSADLPKRGTKADLSGVARRAETDLSSEA
jgi:hypothetical protein